MKTRKDVDFKMDTQVNTKMKIHKTVNEVFEAIVDPVKIGNYWFSSSSERWEQGKSVTLRYDEYEAEGVISILEVEESKKIVFSWGVEHGEETVVTITLKKLDDKSTIIEVTESGLREDDPEIVNKMIGQKEGWVYMLSCLKGYLEYGVKDLRASLIH
ncbi:uncharacterized protein YndB with AHSA1/START domain [Virgibacillus litoralis]|uniref:Uncharacterized protein YndB with AHSA1/START domain n=2 Tax=Virgibacillus litoralis TaxID=578221 RepID=A0ABS4HIY4_9BACI|nr:uncharacterized protein YndB with AHSA1/START domain [Virgibacillus litoralis]